MRKITLSFLMMILLVITGQAKIIYVTPDGSNTNDGTTWDKAVADLQQAHKLAVKGDQIWMSAGTYDLSILTPTNATEDGAVAMVLMKDGVDIYGGFKKGDLSIEARERANPTTEPWNYTNSTIITSSSPLTVRPFDRADKDVDSKWKSVMDGIKFYSIHTNNARILYLNTGTTLQNCWMEACSSTNATATYTYFERGALVQDCLFEKCTGSGIILQLRGATKGHEGMAVRNCTFRDNAMRCLNLYNTEGNYPTNSDDGITVTGCKFLNNTGNEFYSVSSGGMRFSVISDCLFEGNSGATVVTTNYNGLINIGGEGSFMTNCIIRNNKNTIAEGEDYKHSLIFVNDGGIVSNTLIANNECIAANLSIRGLILNSTIVNNIGIAQVDLFGGIINSVILNNTPTTEAAPIRFYGPNCWLPNCAMGSEDDVINPNGADVYSSVYTDINTLVSPTTFIGNTKSEADYAMLVDANFSLTDDSPCIDAGEEVGLLGDDGILEAIRTYFEKDLGGMDRFSNTGKISIGAYQGKVTGNSISSTMNDNRFATVYPAENGIILNSSVAGVVKIYSITGSQVLSSIVSEGEQSIKLTKGQMYVVNLITNFGNQSFKVIVR